MTDPVDIILPQLAAIRGKLDGIDMRLREQTVRLSAIEARLGAIESRLDIWNERIAHVETRLELAGPP